MNVSKWGFTFLAALLSFTMATAQERIVTLDEAISLAIENNRDLEITRLEIDRADNQVREAIGNALPDVSAAGTYSHALKKPVFFLPDFSEPESGRIIPIEIGANHSYQMGFTAQQILFNAAVITGVGTSKVYAQAAREVHRSAYNSTVSNVKRAFYTVLYTKEVLALTQASLKNAEQNENQARILFEQGIVSNYDLIRANVKTENTRPVVTESERNVQLAKNNLKIVLGISADERIDVDGALVFEAVDSVYVGSAEATLRERNATLKALELQAQVNDELVDIYRAEYLPTLSAFGNYQWQAQNDALSSTSFNDFVASSQVGLSLSVNLFNGFRTTARVDQARIEYMKSQEQFQQTRDVFETRIQNIRYRLEEAARRVQSQTRTVEQAQKGYDIAMTRYSSGSATLLEANDADLALAQARVNRVQAVFDYQLARIDLEELLSANTPATDENE